MLIKPKPLFFPTLRFKGHQDSWSRMRLVDVCTKIQDGNYGAFYPKAEEFVKSGIPFLTSKALGGDGVIKPDKIDYITVEKHAQLKKAHLECHDVIFTNRGANVGVIGIVGKSISNGNIGPQLTLIRCNKKLALPLFIKSVMCTPHFNKQVHSQDSGSAMNFFGIGSTEKFRIHIPSLPEQKKIADFLSAVDRKIQQLTRKKELLEQYKKGLMQKLLSQEIRFKDANGDDFPDWKLKRLKEYLVQHDEISTENNQYPVLTSSRKGIMFQKDYFNGNDVASKDTTGYNVVPRGYFTYRHMSDDLVFKFNINTITDRGIVSTLYPVFTVTGINQYYLKMKLNDGEEFKRYAIIQKQGGSRTYMYFKKLTLLQIDMPTIDEQDKIMTIIDVTDRKIELMQNYLSHANTFKKGLLQQLFI